MSRLYKHSRAESLRKHSQSILPRVDLNSFREEIMQTSSGDFSSLYGDLYRKGLSSEAAPHGPARRIQAVVHPLRVSLIVWGELGLTLLAGSCFSEMHSRSPYRKKLTAIAPIRSTRDGLSSLASEGPRLSFFEGASGFSSKYELPMFALAQLTLCYEGARRPATLSMNFQTRGLHSYKVVEMNC